MCVYDLSHWRILNIVKEPLKQIMEKSNNIKKNQLLVFTLEYTPG